MAWITTKDGRRVDTDWFDKEKQIANNAKEAKQRENTWHYPGIKEQISKIEKSNKSVEAKIKAIDGQLKVISASEKSEGSNSHLLTYRRQLRMMRKKLLEGK